MAAEPRRQSVARVVTVDIFYRRAPAYSAELKPGNLVANPPEEGLIAQQRDRQIEEDSRRRENEERVAQYNSFTARASNRSAWARAGMG